MIADPAHELAEPVRVDKWLWAARVFKSRSLAQQACRGGHVTVNGHGAQPARALRIGDRVEIKREARVLVLEVAALATKRGPAPVARTLYVDHSPPPPPKELDTFVVRDRGAGRPTKRDRRTIRRARGW
ncbi:MAG: RNA-binding S4 domain-containing protein [bacterium]